MYVEECMPGRFQQEWIGKGCFESSDDFGFLQKYDTDNQSSETEKNMTLMIHFIEAGNQNIETESEIGDKDNSPPSEIPLK